MFRPMRRFRQQLSKEECESVLTKNTCGVLAVLGDEDYPYAVPLSYVYHEGVLYFHCAKEGHKLDAVRKHEKVSFCVVDQDNVVPEKFTTYFRSVIVFGKAFEITDPTEKYAAIDALAERYSPKNAEKEQEIDRTWNRLCMLKLIPEHITGKQAVELLDKNLS